MDKNITYRAIRREFRAARIACQHGIVAATAPAVPMSEQRAAATAAILSSASLFQTASAPFTSGIWLNNGSAFAAPQSRDAAATEGGDKLPRSTPSARKARAQVAPPVAHSVLQGACELKLDCKRGRKFEQAEPKSEILGVRFQSGELAIIRCKAQMVGVSTNSFIRASALGSDYRPPRNPELVKALIALNRELTAQGSNINQIAKHVNGGTASPAEAEGMLGIIARTHIQTHKAVRAALSQGMEPAP